MAAPPISQDPAGTLAQPQPVLRQAAGLLVLAGVDAHVAVVAQVDVEVLVMRVQAMTAVF